MGLQPPKLCCSSRGSIPVHLSLLPCSLADCPQIQCVHPYVAQQPDELSLELADVLNILDKTDDGMRDGMGMCWESLWKDGLCSRQAAVSLSLQPEGGSGVRVTAREGSYCLLLTANPGCLNCGNIGTASQHQLWAVVELE